MTVTSVLPLFDMFIWEKYLEVVWVLHDIEEDGPVVPLVLGNTFDGAGRVLPLM